MTRRATLVEKKRVPVILRYLRLKCGGVWIRVEVGAVFHQSKMIRGSAYDPESTGAADIIGIWQSYPVAWECKSDTGSQESEQVQWQRKWEKSGGIYFIVKDTFDVDRGLQSIGETQKRIL